MWQAPMFRTASLRFVRVKRLWIAISWGLGLILTEVCFGQVSITEFAMPAGVTPNVITTGPDGALWFTEAYTGTPGSGNKIGRITTAGVVTEFPIPTASSDTGCIAAGPDGALWFTGPAANKIGRITTDGAITEFPIPTAAGGPQGIAAGPDGALWFAESTANNIGRITTTGVITEFPIPALVGPFGITAGPDGALWFTMPGANSIGRITTAGVISRFPIPTARSNPIQITTGPDGALWFPEFFAGKIGRITTSGTITEFPVAYTAFGITAGPDGALWFTNSGTSGVPIGGGTCSPPGCVEVNQIGRITTAGVVTGFPVPAQPASKPPSGITTGPDGAIWFTELGGDVSSGFKIGRATLMTGSSAMAQLASGGSWTTTITLINTGVAPGQAVLSFFDDNGNPMQLPLTFAQGSSTPLSTETLTQNVNGGSQLVIQTAGLASQPTQVGWAQILTNASVSGFAVFTQTIGASIQEAVVPLESRATGAFVLPFDNTSNYTTGVALANVATQSANIRVVIRDDTGTVLLTNSIALPAQGHTSFALATNYPNTAQHRGSVEFNTPPNGKISVLGLRFNSTGAFTSIPAVAK
jgi:virginiamycin B lyase